MKLRLYGRRRNIVKKYNNWQKTTMRTRFFRRILYFFFRFTQLNGNTWVSENLSRGHQVPNTWSRYWFSSPLALTSLLSCQTSSSAEASRRLDTTIHPISDVGPPPPPLLLPALRAMMAFSDGIKPSRPAAVSHVNCIVCRVFLREKTGNNLFCSILLFLFFFFPSAVVLLS